MDLQKSPADNDNSWRCGGHRLWSVAKTTVHLSHTQFAHFNGYNVRFDGDRNLCRFPAAAIPMVRGANSDHLLSRRTILARVPNADAADAGLEHDNGGQRFWGPQVWQNRRPHNRLLLHHVAGVDDSGPSGGDGIQAGRHAGNERGQKADHGRHESDGQFFGSGQVGVMRTKRKCSLPR